MNKQNYELSTTVWYQLICITAKLNTVYKWCGSIASVCFALINTLNIYGIIKRTKYATIVQASYLLKAAVICITLFIRHLLHTMEIQFDGHWKKNEKKTTTANVDDENERVHTQKIIKKLPKEDINDSHFYLKCFHLFPSYCYSILASTIFHRKRLLPHFHTSQKIVP